MGEAKRRGTYEERKRLAIERKAQERKPIPPPVRRVSARNVLAAAAKKE